VWEQGGSSRKALVVDLSSSFDEGDLIAGVSRDEFTRKLFSDLNQDFLGPSDDGKIIILNDSNEEGEVHEEKATNAEAAPSSATRSRVPIVFAARAKA
jgi:hypothetical protein